MSISVTSRSHGCTAGKDEGPEGGGGGAIEVGTTSGLGAESGLPEEGRWVPTSSGLGKKDSG